MSELRAPSAAGGHVPAGPSRAERPRNNFDGLRLLAALLVVYGHQTIDRTGTDGLRLVMFFSISGFLVAGSWTADSHFGRFATRRFLRLWPAYAVLVVGCAAISAIFPARDMPEMSRMASAFYLSNLWYSGFDWGFFPAGYPMMNRSLWMLPFEIDIYLAFALVALAGRRARIAVAVALVLMAAWSHQTPVATGRILECWSLYFGGFFAFGVLLRELPWLRGGAIVSFCVVCGVTALWLDARSAGLLLVIPPAAAWIGLRSWPVLRSASRFGDLSFGIFLWSFPVQQVTRLWMDPRWPVVLQLGVVLLQLIPIAWLSCHLIEQPALRRKPRRPPGQHAGRQRDVSHDRAAEVPGDAGAVQHAASGSGDHGLRTALHAQLAECRGEVRLDAADLDREAPTDEFVRKPFGDELHDLGLTRAER